MLTFKQLLEKSEQLTNRRAVLNHLVEHIELTFRPVSGQQGPSTLLRPDKIKVPDSAFEEVVTKVLEEIRDIDKELTSIQGSTLLPTDVAKPK